MKQFKTFLILLTLSFISLTNCAQDMENQPKQTKVLIKTTAGDIVVVLYDGTQEHKENFIKLVNNKFYDGLLFHRVINGFMVQGGDPDSKNAPAGKTLGNGGPGYTVAAELLPKYYHKKGALSAARIGDQMNPTRRSSGSQFFIVTGKVYTEAELDAIENKMHTKFTPEQRKDYTTVGGTPFLDAQYSVFGEVVEGLDIAISISRVPKDTNDRPKDDVKIIEMKIID
ncbi:MAG: peptidylprolyl isomerase [Bacteroidota bacterium]|nr:peptidylprolyl isomerase [Bacteroidota bacterium]